MATKKYTKIYVTLDDYNEVDSAYTTLKEAEENISEDGKIYEVTKVFSNKPNPVVQQKTLESEIISLNE